MDVNIIFGVVEASIALALMLNTDDIMFIILASTFGFVSLISLFISLLTGATSELAFSNIYRHLSPFLVNELSMVERKVHSRIFKICKKLVHSENRSFVILGNFPLTAGSVPSVSPPIKPLIDASKQLKSLLNSNFLPIDCCLGRNLHNPLQEILHLDEDHKL